MKEKGFTLIELLAVIVILAIIALIAVPIVINIIEDTNKSAVKRSTENYIDAVELYIARSELDNNKLKLKGNNKYNVNNSTLIEDKNYLSINELVEVKGSKPTGKEDYITLNNVGQVIEGKLTISGYIIEIKNGNITNVKKDKIIKVKEMSINITEQTMEKNSTFKIIPSFNPEDASNQEVTYESSNTSVVTVDELGNVKAVNSGTAKITVTSKENKSIKAECNITVIVSATSLIISPKEKQIRVGESVQLSGTIEPGDVTSNALTWSTSNANVATVNSNGLVIGVSVGEVTITASTVNGIEDTSKITVKVPEPYVDETGTTVQVTQGLIPILYDGTNWKVADIYSKWYDYNNQEWANAVILNSGVTKSVGQTVDVTSEVKAMFVYIPRYEYKIEGQYGRGGTSATSPGEIEINFIDKTKTTASSGYRVHPAFTFGSEQLSGIWVGKFETSAAKTSTCYTSSSTANCDNTNQDPYIIPNVNSLRNQKVSNQFTTAQKFNSYVTNGDSHMMKNNEWGAVAYLSQSRYGKYGNSKYSGAEKQVRINNCSKYITGVGANSQNDNSSADTCTANTYTTANGQAASTTGNITGIYDMSGGAWEYVMGYYTGASSTWGATSSSNYAGFTGAPNAKYFDAYTTTSNTTACSGGVCYGHALSETSGWYGDYAYFVNASNPWFLRGGVYNHTSDACVFASYYRSGNAGSHVSFRVALVQTTN